MSDETRLWIMIAVVIVTNLITFGVTFMYWQDRFYQVLRENAADRRSRQAQLENIRMRERVYGNIQMGDLER